MIDLTILELLSDRLVLCVLAGAIVLAVGLYIIRCGEDYEKLREQDRKEREYLDRLKNDPEFTKKQMDFLRKSKEFTRNDWFKDVRG